MNEYMQGRFVEKNIISIKHFMRIKMLFMGNFFRKIQTKVICDMRFDDQNNDCLFCYPATVNLINFITDCFYRS